MSVIIICNVVFLSFRHSYGEIVSGIATIKMYFSKGEDPMTYFAERTQRVSIYR